MGRRRIRRLRPPAAAGLAVLGVACVLLPWWRAADAPVLLVDGPPLPLTPDAWTGIELIGAPLAVGLAVLGAVALALGASTAACAVAGLVGAATAAGAGRVLVTWGPSTAQGAWFAAAFGVAAVLVAIGHRPVWATLAAALVGALVTGIPRMDGTAAADGPFVRLADLADAGVLRSGGTTVPTGPGLRLTVADGTAAAVTDDGIATAAHGRVDVVARVPADDRIRHAGGILGVAGDRVARFIAPGTLLVTGLHAGDPTAVRVVGVAEASPVGSDGTVWLRGYGEPTATVRSLDLGAYDGATTVDVTLLPVVTIDAPVDRKSTRLNSSHKP